MSHKIAKRLRKTLAHIVEAPGPKYVEERHFPGRLPTIRLAPSLRSRVQRVKRAGIYKAVFTAAKEKAHG